MQKVIVTKMVAEWDEDAGDYDEMLFATQSKPVVVDTMKDAKFLIEEQVSNDYNDNDNYVVNDVTRVEKDGSWIVTAWYDGGRAEWKATEVEF